MDFRRPLVFGLYCNGNNEAATPPPFRSSASVPHRLHSEGFLDCFGEIAHAERLLQKWASALQDIAPGGRVLGIPRHEENANARVSLGKLCGQFMAALTHHHQIRQDEIDFPRQFGAYRERRNSTSGLENAVAKLLQAFAHIAANVLVIID
jgi:hypothetical protein